MELDQGTRTKEARRRDKGVSGCYHEASGASLPMHRHDKVDRSPVQGGATSFTPSSSEANDWLEQLLESTLTEALGRESRLVGFSNPEWLYFVCCSLKEARLWRI